MKARTICIKKRNTKRETHRKKNKKMLNYNNKKVYSRKRKTYAAMMITTMYMI